MKRTEKIVHRESPKARREIESLRSRLSRLRQFGDQDSQAIMGTATALAGAFAGGAYEHRISATGAHEPASIGGLDWRLTWGVGIWYAGRKMFGGSSTGQLLRNAGLGLACAGAAAAGLNSSLFLPAAGSGTSGSART